MALTGTPFPLNGSEYMIRDLKSGNVIQLFVKPEPESGFNLYLYDKKKDHGFTMLYEDGSKVIIYTTEDLNYIFWERGYWYFYSRSELKGEKRFFQKGVYPFSRKKNSLRKSILKFL
jgi:hypothetical protein